MKRYALELNGLYWELRDEESKLVLLRSSNKIAAISKATELGLETGGTLNVYKKNGQWDETRNFDRMRRKMPRSKAQT